ncbi:MAG: hypothetical protein HFJ46_01715 [Clostridia bacterium]|nr:hypothetical protein [Clostridia bacterium]
MSKLTLEEILNIPQLSFYLEPQEFLFLTNRNKDFEVMANLYNAEKVDSLMFRSNEVIAQEKLIPNTSDSIATKGFGDAMKNILVQNSKLVNRDNLLLLLGGLAAKYLKEISMPNKSTEIVYSNGDIINVKDNVAIKRDASTGMQELDIADVRENLVEGILIANRELQDVMKRNKKFGIRGIYFGRGLGATQETLDFSVQDLDDMRRDKLVFQALSIDKIKELCKKKLLTYSDILKAAGSSYISKTDALILLKEGILKKEDVLKRVFKVSDFSTIMRRKDEALDTKLLLYTIGQTDIKTLEKHAEESYKRKEEEISSSTLEKMAKYYDHKKIGELLTHNVLNYNESKRFLKVLIDQKIITDEEEKYFEQIMEDFKCNELLNQIETEELDKQPSDKTGKPLNLSGLTIDPKFRMEYLRSIGSVKRVKINGEMTISEDAKNRRKTNSLDGYELLVIPDKKIAILEKFYQVTRDRNGHMRYKANSEGDYIPAVENATYILPIGLAKDLVESKNKRDLIMSPYVYRTFHTMDWVNSLETKMLKINPEIKFEKENTEIWKKRISDNYKKNRDLRTID